MKSSDHKTVCISALVLFTFIGLDYPPLHAQSHGKNYSPSIASQSNEPNLALSGFQLPKGIHAELFAAEPLLANPVAFCIDAQGRFYVCETFRQEKGVEDNRSHMTWLHDDLALQTVEQRLEMFKKHLGEQVSAYGIEHDRIRLIEDTNRDGKADKSTIFAEGFNHILDGTGAGVLARDGNVYYTCIPKFWKLRDTNADGIADEKKSLHHGYGVRVAFRGHDMHGLTMGPDGRIYYSIGDRGYNITTREGKRLVRPDTGAVFRCEPDGSHLEVFAYGLRNPQELAFDDYGNLFTGDNNSDSGDQARWVNVVEGGDTGWRMYYQYLEDRGPWNREMIWYPRDTPPLEKIGPGKVPAGSRAKQLQPAYTIPPIANIADGPSGLTYYPGVGLSDRYKGHFFLADFRGNSGQSGIRSFAVKPKGASFELVDSHQFIWKILATDIDFGYDGGLYVTDWVDGWNGPGKGRIYKFTDKANVKHVAAANTDQLMRTGFTKLTSEKLVKLLEHPDRRVRLEAQFALASRNSKSAALTLHKVTYGENRIASLHATWGLGQLARKDPEITRHIGSLWFHSDPLVRAQAVKVFGDALAANRSDVLNIWPNLGERLSALLQDHHPRVQLQTSLALGKLADPLTIHPLLKLLKQNNDNDLVIRHAAVMGLTGIGHRHPKTLLRAARQKHKSARMGILLALRRLEHPEIARYLNDRNPALVLEAARAVNDVPINKATPQLAALSGQPNMSDALLRRVMYANLRQGKPENAHALAKVAADTGTPEHLRLEALANLQSWDNPPPLDRVTGAWRPLQPRSADGLANIIREHLKPLFAGSNKVRRATARLAAKYGVKQAAPVLYQIATNKKQNASLRVEALQALESFNDKRLPELTELAIADSEPAVRSVGRKILAALDPNKAVTVLDQAILTGETTEKQQAIAVLTSLKNDSADTVLLKWMDKLIVRDVPAEIQLDLLQAAKARNTETFQQVGEQFHQTRPENDPLAQYRESIAGGNVERGRKIFFGRAAASCRRCHKIDGDGGEVGPDLSKIAKDKKRDYLLEAIVLPNKQIAKGYDSVILAMEDGKVYTGIVKADDGATMKIMNDKGEIITINKDEIDDQAKGKSAMPEDLIKQLTKSDIRDLVEYLTTLK